MDRLIIFGDPALAYSGHLAGAALAAAGKAEDLRVVALCDTGASTTPPPFIGKVRRLLALTAVRAFNGGAAAPPRGFSVPDLRVAARRHEVEVVVPPGRDINHPAFVRSMKERHGANLALSLGCRQIFGRGLLGAFDMAVNGHDGLLPAYRGLYATAWSLYREEGETGFTWHVMNERIDGGNILMEERMKVHPALPRGDILGQKMRRAGAMMEELLPLMSSRSAGRPQDGHGAYFGAREYRAVTTVPDPSALPWDELRRRLRAFGTLKIGLMGRMVEVTALRQDGSPGKGGPTAFVTSDGRAVRATRFRFLPLPVYGALKALRVV